MATFSQFKSKYIVERRGGSKTQVGQEGTRNIVKKLLGQNVTPEDGGKVGQGKIEKELGLNDRNTTTNRRGRKVIKKTYTPPDKVTSQNIQTQSIKNQVKNKIGQSRNIDKTINTNVSKGSGDGITGSKGNTTVKPNTTTVTNTKKTVDVKGKIDQALKDYQNKLKNKVNKSNVNVNQSTKTNVIDLPKTNTRTRFSGRIGDVTNISKNKGAQLPGNLNPNPIKDNKISKEIARIADRNKANKILKNMDTSAFDDIGTKKNPLSKKAFSDFKTNLVNKAPVKKALKVLGPAAAVVGSGLDFRNTYKASQAQGDTKRRSLGKGLSRVAGGLVGGALGAAGGSAIAPGAGTAIGGYGGYVAGQELGQKTFDTLTTSKGRKQIAKSFKNFRNKAMKPVGG